MTPDVCIIPTASLMHDLKGPFMDCAESGVNAITTGEEAFYPWSSSHQTTALLDDLAKRNGCPLCGTVTSVSIPLEPAVKPVQFIRHLVSGAR